MSVSMGTGSNCCQALTGCGFDMVEAFILTYGFDLLQFSDLPKNVRRLIRDIINEENVLASCTDSLDKHIHRICIDLSACMLKGSLCEYVKTLRRRILL